MCILIDLGIRFLYYSLFAWVILSWVEVPSTHPLGALKITLDRLFSKILTPIRKFIPPLRIGGAGIDISPIILIFGINFLRPYIYSFLC